MPAERAEAGDGQDTNMIRYFLIETVALTDDYGGAKTPACVAVPLTATISNFIFNMQAPAYKVSKELEVSLGTLVAITGMLRPVVIYQPIWLDTDEFIKTGNTADEDWVTIQSHCQMKETHFEFREETWSIHGRSSMGIDYESIGDLTYDSLKTDPWP